MMNRRNRGGYILVGGKSLTKQWAVVSAVVSA